VQINIIVPFKENNILISFYHWCAIYKQSTFWFLYWINKFISSNVC